LLRPWSKKTAFKIRNRSGGERQREARRGRDGKREAKQMGGKECNESKQVRKL
jgi:hypothetical protein